MRNLLLFLHIISFTVWVGGMFFAWQVLRPVAVAQLEAPQRLRLWLGVFERFFPWVWAAVLLLRISGVTLFEPLGFAGAAKGVHLMILTGFIMAAIFFFVYFSLFAALRRSVTAEDWSADGAVLARIRRLIGINLLLGVITIASATLVR